jgi:hypothetical protein
MEHRKTIWLVLIAATLIYQYPGKDLWAYIYAAIHENEYRDLAVQCEITMHDWMVIEQKVKETPDQQLQNRLAEAERAMSVCHKHDVIRKKLLMNGVDEDRIRLIELEALADESVPFEAFIRPHKMM